MIAKLQSPWIASLIGLFLYVGTTIALWQVEPVYARTGIEAGEGGPSWTFKNPEVDALLADLERQQKVLATRAKALDEYALRLDAEKRELEMASQKVLQLRSEFDSNVVHVLSAEAANIKKLGRTYADMSPAAAARVLSQMDEKLVLRILSSMKEAQVGPILGAMAQRSPQDAERVAALTERLRVVVPPDAKSQSK